MAVRKKKGPAVPVKPVQVQVEPPGFWELRISPFLHRYATAITIFLVAIASLRIVSTYTALSFTVDEPGHFACGLEYLQQHVYRFEAQHPPLARAATAVLPYLTGTRLPQDHDINQNLEGRKILLASHDLDRMAVLTRLGILPFFWLACLVLFLWASRGFGREVAVIATALFTFIPPVLAHAGLATTDMALTACLVSAFCALLVWAESPDWKRAMLLGVAAAAAVLSKFTALGYLPACAVLALAAFLAVKRPSLSTSAALARSRAATFSVAVIAGALAIWAAYWFSIDQVSGWNLRLPAPALFEGIRTALVHNNNGHPSYLLGETSNFGWWYYFPIVLLVKTPTALLLAVVAGSVVCWKHRRNPKYLCVPAICLGILIPAMTSRVNIGVRHILPIYAGLAILGALGFARLARKSALIPAALLAWIAISGAIYHPDYLSYFNEFAASKPEAVLVDSDLDWDQNIKMLAGFLRQQHATHFVHDFEEIHFSLHQPYGFPPSTPLQLDTPAKGWTVVRSTVDKQVRRNGQLAGTDWQSLLRARDRNSAWYDSWTPTKRIGGLLLYYRPE